MSTERIYTDPQLGDILFRKRKGIRRLGIRVHPVKGISVSVPYLLPYSAAVAFFKLKRDWVVQAVDRQKARYRDVPKGEPGQIEQMRRQAKAELPVRLKELADRYGFIYNKVTIKHNSTNWGSCSTRGNINLNLNIVRLPLPLRDYVLLHEHCHLRHHDHGQAFHLLLEHVCTDNILKLCEGIASASGGSASALSADDLLLAHEIARKAAASKARYPLDSVCTKTIKQYPLI